MQLFKKVLILSTLILSIGSVQTGCYYDREEDLYPQTSGGVCSDTVGVKYSTFVAIQMTNNCTGCHGGSAPSAGIKLDNHASLKSYILSNRAPFLGCMYHSSGYSPMPKGSSKMPICDVKKIEAWINGGMLND